MLVSIFNYSRDVDVVIKKMKRSNLDLKWKRGEKKLEYFYTSSS